MMNASNIWQFSASSKEQLERCIASAQFDSRNKWIQKFKITQAITDTGTQAEPINLDSEECLGEKKVANETLEPDTVGNAQQIIFFQEVVNADPISHFSQIVDMCEQDQSIFSFVLNHLSPLSLQKLCNHIFSNKDINRTFLERFYQYFLPVYLKREHTWLSLDTLVRAKESHGSQFSILLLMLLNEKGFPSNILQEFVSTLDGNELSSFVRSIVDHDLSDVMFVHNLYTIFLAYKECQKDEIVQNYVLKKLTQTSSMCPHDKNYGRFLLTFIQSCKCTSNLDALEKLVDTHRSAFKRPCVNALNNLR